LTFLCIRITDREVAAVDEWRSESSAAFHSMRDHPYHTSPLMAGLMGHRKKGEKPLHELSQAFSTLLLSSDFNLDFAEDQNMLSEHIFFVVRPHLLEHVSWYCKTKEPKDQWMSFPTR